MCGISGVFNSDGLNQKDLSFIDNSLAIQHSRGPDFADFKRITNKLIFGHNRLSILDLEIRSNQPFSLNNSDWLIFNGEIYNYRELAKKYKHELLTTGDTEVLWLLLGKFGCTILDELEGMFTFAFYSDSNEQLYLGRDRFGIKPLYIFNGNTTFAFASSMKSLLHYSNTLDKSVLPIFFRYQTVVGANSVIKNISQLKPGHFLKIDTANGLKEECQWFNPYEPTSYKKSKDSSLKDIFIKSVEKRLISDVPIGIFLSGGIDSTAILSAATICSAAKINTFTVGFDEDEDESELANKVASYFNSNHNRIKLNKDSVADEINNAVLHYDMPSADGLNTWIVSKSVSEAGMRVALSGLGGDELFAGYPTFKRYQSLKKWYHLWPFLQQILRFLPSKSEKIKLLSHIDLTPSEIVRVSRLLFTDKEIFTLLKILKGNNENIKDFSTVTDCEFYYYTLPLLLRDTDQMSMAHSLEVRVPFFDFHFQSVVREKLDFYATPTGNPKQRFISALEGLIPDFVQNQPKKGFTLPMNYWLKNQLQSFTYRGLKAPILNEILYSDKVEDRWQRFQRTKSNSTDWSRLWHIAVFGHWLERNNIDVN